MDTRLRDGCHSGWLTTAGGAVVFLASTSPLLELLVSNRERWGWCRSVAVSVLQQLGTAAANVPRSGQGVGSPVAVER